MLHLEEKGCKSSEIPVRHDLEGIIVDYLDASGRRASPKDTLGFETKRG